MQEVEYLISGAFGGVCTVLVGHPLDTVKVRLQTMPRPAPGQPPLYSGTLDCFKKIVKNEGPLGVYKGMSAPLIAITPIFAISFMSFGLGKKLFAAADPSAVKYPNLFAAGAFAGLMTTVIMAPGERIKSLLQIQATGSKVYADPIDCMKRLFREGGIASIYRGSVATLLRDIPASGMYFMTYEAIRDRLTQHGTVDATFLGTIFAGACAGIAHWLVGMPPDVLKSRIQTAPAGTYPNGIRDAFRALMKTEGPAALYTGLTPVMLRAVPANGACFFGFEVGQKFLNLFKDKKST